MSACPILTVTAVEAHPDETATHLNVVRGAAPGGEPLQFVSQKLEGGVPRYKVGDLVAHIPDGALLPDDLMKRLDVWDHQNNRGHLKGAGRNRMKASRFRGFLSEGMLMPAAEVPGGPHAPGDDASAALGITFAQAA